MTAVKFYSSATAFVANLLISAISLIVCSYFQIDWFVIAFIIAQLIWDFIFFRSVTTTHDRGPDEFIGQLRAARTVMTSFMAFYGVIIGAALTLDDVRHATILAAIAKVALPPY